ncbi:MAG: hypothetical protein EZS28_056662, partial [Streblomastix strix]
MPEWRPQMVTTSTQQRLT